MDSKTIKVANQEFPVSRVLETHVKRKEKMRRLFPFGIAVWVSLCIVFPSLYMFAGAAIIIMFFEMPKLVKNIKRYINSRFALKVRVRNDDYSEGYVYTYGEYDTKKEALESEEKIQAKMTAQALINSPLNT